MVEVQIVPLFLPIMVQIVPFSFLLLLLSQTIVPMILICFQGVISLIVVIVPCGMTIAQRRTNRCKPTTVGSFLINLTIFLVPSGETCIDVARVAIPIFRARVSPVFDSCLQILMVDIEENRQISRSQLYLDQLSPSLRLDVLRDAGVTTVICGGISEVFHNMLNSAGIRTITGIAGEIEEVITAFLADRLDQAYFYMPGRGGQ
jgi:predicted Fe-Mo cluster-binding NifX family protein